MAVRLRLARFGKKNRAVFRLVAIDKRKKRDGKVLETLGSYDPHKGVGKFSVDKARLAYWLSVGAQPSETVKQLLSR